MHCQLIQESLSRSLFEMHPTHVQTKKPRRFCRAIPTIKTYREIKDVRGNAKDVIAAQ